MRGTSKRKKRWTGRLGIGVTKARSARRVLRVIRQEGGQGEWITLEREARVGQHLRIQANEPQAELGKWVRFVDRRGSKRTHKSRPDGRAGVAHRIARTKREEGKQLQKARTEWRRVRASQRDVAHGKQGQQAHRQEGKLRLKHGACQAIALAVRGAKKSHRRWKFALTREDAPCKRVRADEESPARSGRTHNGTGERRRARAAEGSEATPREETNFQE
ncbi:hypothetical protein ERJ75_000583400 [Trypanosoma vivax]|nr:hypothetical protein ERJ75_000583400 [Trypanosoma vivax]